MLEEPHKNRCSLFPWVCQSEDFNLLTFKTVHILVEKEPLLIHNMQNKVLLHFWISISKGKIQIKSSNELLAWMSVSHVFQHHYITIDMTQNIKSKVYKEKT